MSDKITNGVTDVHPVQQWQTDVAAGFKPASFPDQHLRDLTRAAEWIGAFGAVIAFFGVICGIAVACITGGREFAGFSDKTHPYVGLGLGVVAGSLVIGFVVILLSLWAKAWAREAQR